MIEIFICIILIPFYFFKYIWHKSKEDAFDNEIKNDERVYNDKIEEWKSKVTDIEIERDVYEIVHNENKLKRHKKEIEDVLCTEFGMQKGVVSEVFLHNYQYIEPSALEFLSRILMANRGKLRKTDATGGIFIGYDNGTYEWMRKIKCNTKETSMFLLEMTALWINKKLKAEGIDEAFLLESWQGFSADNPSGRYYYLLKDDADEKKFLNARKEPRKDFSHSYRMRDTEMLRWGASVRGFYTNSVTLRPIEQYEGWYLR